MRRIYLDHAATTPVAPEVVDAMLPLLRETWGNPSSPHGRGRSARAAVDDARDRLAAVLGCVPRELTFTSGGTEADNLAMRGVVQRWGAEHGRHLVVSAVEHEAVLSTAISLAERDEAELTVVPCDRDGRVDPERIAAAVRDDTVLVALMLANNEVGTVQEVGRAARLARGRNPRVLVHTDAVQALGRVQIDLAALDVDLLSVSAHKCYGPKGCGALYARWGTHMTAQLEGGGQERGRRSGTENVAAIAGFAVAAELVERERPVQATRQAALRDALESAILERAPGTRVAARCRGPSAQPERAARRRGAGGRAGRRPRRRRRRGVQWLGVLERRGPALARHDGDGEDPRTTALLRLSIGRGTSAADVGEATERIVAAIAVAATPGPSPAGAARR